MAWLKISTKAKVVAAVAAVVVVAGGAGFALWSGSTSGHAADGYRAERRALDASLVGARQQGYTAGDLAPITAQESALDGAQAPWWLPGRPGYYEGLTTRTSQLRRQLAALEQQLVEQARTDTTHKSDAAKASIAQAQQANAPDPDVQSLQQRLDAVARAQGAAHTLKDYRAADQQPQAGS